MATPVPVKAGAFPTPLRRKLCRQYWREDDLLVWLVEHGVEAHKEGLAQMEREREVRMQLAANLGLSSPSRLCALA